MPRSATSWTWPRSRSCVSVAVPRGGRPPVGLRRHHRYACRVVLTSSPAEARGGDLQGPARCRAAFAALRRRIACHSTRRLYRGALRSSRPRFGAPVHPVVQDPSGRTGGFGFNVRGRCGGRRLLGGKHHRREAVSRRVWVDRRRLRAAVPPMACEAIPAYTRCWKEKLKSRKAEPARTVYTVRSASASRQGGNGI
jgi:hypothetical protein